MVTFNINLTYVEFELYSDDIFLFNYFTVI